MNELTLDTVVEQFMECLSKSWSEALQRLRGVPSATTLNQDWNPNAGSTESSWISVSFDGLLVGEAAVMISEDDSAARQGAADPPQPEPGGDTQHHRSWEDPLKQAVVLALKAFQEQHGPLLGRIEASHAPAWEPAKVLALTATAEGHGPLHLVLLCGPALQVNRSAAAPDGHLPDSGTAENLDLVMNAALDVSLRFGQQNLTLGDVAQLGPGSVVELDRRIQEPVELVLDGKVLARGEVVVVDGNYGLRVTEICNGGLP